MLYMKTAEEIEDILGITDDQILLEIESVDVPEEQLDRFMSGIRASFPIPAGTGGTGAYCCGDGGPNNAQCTTTSPNDVCYPSLPNC